MKQTTVKRVYANAVCKYHGRVEFATIDGIDFCSLCLLTYCSQYVLAPLEAQCEEFLEDVREEGYFFLPCQGIPTIAEPRSQGRMRLELSWDQAIVRPLKQNPHIVELRR